MKKVKLASTAIYLVLGGLFSVAQAGSIKRTFEVQLGSDDLTEREDKGAVNNWNDSIVMGVDEDNGK